MPILETLGGAAISAVGQIGGQLFGSAMQNRADERANKRMLNFYNIQRQDALNDWRMQADYNSPTNQIERLKQAGISPYAANGNAMLAGGMQNQPRPSSGSTPSSYQVNSAQNLFSNLGQIQQMKLLDAQVAKTQAETKSIGVTTSVDENTLLPIRLAEQAQKEQDAAVKSQTIENLKAQLLQTVSTTALNKIEAIYKNALLSGQSDLQQKQIQQIQANMREVTARIANLNAQTNKENALLPQNVRLIQAQIANLNAQSNKTGLYGVGEMISEGVDRLKNVNLGGLGSYQTLMSAMKKAQNK